MGNAPSSASTPLASLPRLTALRLLVTAAERCASVIGALILTNVPTRVRRIIQITGLHTVLIIDTTCNWHTRERT